MKIHGLQKMTLLDFPGLVACTVFLGGCDLRCPFCHNAEILDMNAPEVMDEKELLAFLETRRGKLDGVAITGGEPTLQPDLMQYIKKIKDIGYLVKLDTNGFNPKVLSSLIEDRLIDYSAVDIKAGHDNYAKAVGLKNVNLSPLEETISILSKNSIDYEFRTTAVKGIHTKDDFMDIAKWLPGDCKYFIQNYKETDGIAGKVFESFDKEELEQFLDIVKPHIPLSSLRGVD